MTSTPMATDLNIPYPASGVSSDVQRMQRPGPASSSAAWTSPATSLCPGPSSSTAQDDKLWLNGNDQNELDQYPTLMKGVYFTTSHVPFTAPTQYYPGLKTYLTAMQKYSPKYVHDEVAIQGWEGAALLAAGIKAAGSNLTQANVINQTNKITDFTAGGLTTPVNWANRPRGHSSRTAAPYIQVQGNGVRLGVRPWAMQVFVCFTATRTSSPSRHRRGRPGPEPSSQGL